jgi:ferredoxin
MTWKEHLMALEKITPASIEAALRRKIEEIRTKPAYLWADGRRNHAVNQEGEAAMKVGVANCTLDFDLWKRLRNPALIGRHPVGLREIWEYYATKDIKKTRPDGTPNYLSMPTPFEDITDRFGRAVIISAMLPLSQAIFERYAEAIVDRAPAPHDAYCKAWAETNQLLDEAVAKLAMALLGPERAVVPMTGDMVGAISQQAVPPIRQGNYHGPCKGGNFPQKSVGVLTGLVQFGVSRIVFRDEVHNGRVERFTGPIRSIVLFDSQEPITDGSDGIVHLTEDWREHVMSLCDFTDVHPDVNRQRYCTYIPDQAREEEGCGLCVKYCPSGAVGNSAPQPNGEYAAAIRQQASRFSDGRLQFDFARCLEERTQKAQLYPDYMCGRCVAACATRGRRRIASAEIGQGGR